MKLSERGRELVQEAALDRMNSETPDNSWCAQFQEFVPLLIVENAELVETLEYAVENIHLGMGERYVKAINMMTEAIRKHKGE